MAKQYGNTWWGQQWLEALSHIDNSNRLPRGKTYANTGRVKDVVLEKQAIRAKVQGSDPKPYKVQISLLPFSDLQKRDILDTISANPFFLSKLLNRELPAALLDELKKVQVLLFPARWGEVKGQCSCPDHAVPCKHLAAVIYLTANEIDKNPFIIFSLKGLDLLPALQAAGHTEVASTQLPVRSVDDLFGPENPQAWPAEYRFSDQLAQQIDFARLPAAKERLLRLLDERPLFCPEQNFKERLAAAYQKIVREDKNELPAPPPAKAKAKAKPELRPETDFFQIYLDDDLAYVGGRATVDGAVEYWDRQRGLAGLAEALQAIPLAQLADHCPAVQALYWARQAAANLWAKAALVPQLVALSAGRYRVRWVPAQVVPEVRELVDQLAQLLPPHLLAFDMTGRPRFPRSPAEQALALLALFLDEWVRQLPLKAELEADALFFDLKPFDDQHFTRRETAQAIQKWLQKFFLQDKAFAPLLRVEEADQGDGFVLSCWVEDKLNTLEPPIKLKEIFTKKNKYAEAQAEVLRDYSLLAEYLPAVGEVVRQKGDHVLEFDAATFVPILLDSLPVIGLLGIKVLLPKGLERLARPRPAVKLTTKGTTGANQGLVGLDQLLSFDWQVALGDQAMSVQEFKKLTKKMQGLVKISGQYVLLDEQNLADVLQKLEQPPGLAGGALLQAALGGEYEGAPVSLSPQVRDLMRQLAEAPPVPLPAGVRASLRPYQQRGYEWLYKNAQLGFGSVLADDMGLGKTLQTITFIQKLKEEGAFADQKALAVLPTTLLTNWSRELAKFAPDLRWAVYHGPKRALDPQADLVLTSYGVARSDEKILAKHPWKLLVIDEAQNIKNVATAQTKAVKKIPAQHLVALSGTPVENRLAEYWSIFDFANRGYLGPLKKFTESFSKPIELERDHQKLDLFRRITAPFILRRLKVDKSIISDLPDKVEQDQICSLTPAQSALYQGVLDHSLKVLAGTEEGFARQGLVLQMITALKQICNHPANYLKKGDTGPELSGKAQTFLELMESILEAGEKAILFTQYKEMGDLLVSLVKQQFHFEPLWLHGGTTRQRRDQMVEQFQHKPVPRLMLLSLKAGGTGLNLTEANHVIHYDLWWNPAVEAQATDRAFRIGQKKNVMVYRFITQATFEEKINEMLKTKRDLANLTVTAGESWVGNLSNAELKEIFTLR
jgi:uncharacterized Zn finger protein/superfamily II DNA or RNA helicase